MLPADVKRGTSTTGAGTQSPSNIMASAFKPTEVELQYIDAEERFAIAVLQFTSPIAL
jgi:hypothetical protein